MNRALPLATIALLALSPAAMAAGKHDTACRDTARCTTVQHDRSGTKAERQHSKRSTKAQPARSHTKTTRQTTTRTKTVTTTRQTHAKRTLPGRALTRAELRRLPQHARHGHSYRVVNNRVVQVDGDTLKVIAALGLLTALMQR